MAKMPVTQLENAYLQRFNLETSHRKCPVRCCQSSVIAQHHNAPKLLLSTDLSFRKSLVTRVSGGQAVTFWRFLTTNDTILSLRVVAS